MTSASVQEQGVLPPSFQALFQPYKNNLDIISMQSTLEQHNFNVPYIAVKEIKYDSTIFEDTEITNADLTTEAMNH